MNPERGATLLHYRLLEPLGQGGMGVVWKALDTTLDREVAIKLLPPEFASDPERLARFEREARLLASLNHPNVAAVYGLHDAHGARFLAMELVRGRTLTEEIARGLAPERAIALAAAIADGLAAAHRQRVVHRDLKPDNIMIDAEGRPKILDFGLAKLDPLAGAGVSGATQDASADASLHEAETQVRPATTATRAGTLLGTIAYMSPEQAQGDPVDPRSDVFSFGIVLYQMITGRRPFGGDNAVRTLAAILRDAPAPLASLAPHAPEPLGRIVARCLEKDPAARYPDASSVRDDLVALRSGASPAASSGASGAPAAPSPAAPSSAAPSRRRALPVAAVVVALAVLAAGTTWFVRWRAGQAYVRDQALPQLQSIVDRVQVLEEGRESWDAWTLSRRIEALAPGEPLVRQLAPKFTRAVSITSDPPGAEVSVRYYDEPEAPPIVIGRTPLTHVPYPRGFTRLHLELTGRPPVDDVRWNFGFPEGDDWSYVLPAPAALPQGMSRIEAGGFEMFMPGFEHLPTEKLAPFEMDCFEVTNREYKRFVDAGGYRDPKYWTVPFVDGTRTLRFEEALARFVDRTGRPGPATWEAGTHAADRADFPVGGVSWYEAAAYAAWAGKRLPTVYHWNRVAYTVASARIIPLSNLSGGSGPVKTGSTKSESRFGVHDLAGNVREWVSNATAGGTQRYILGGGWNDPDYAFADAFAQPAFDRSASNGFRCIRIPGPEPALARLDAALERKFRDFHAEKPVSDPVFAQYLRQFTYDRGPLAAKVEEETRTDAYVRQKVSFNAAYGGERMTAYVFLPLEPKPPLQVVVMFPGSGAIGAKSSAKLEPGRADFFVTSGRALVWPIFKSTYERADDLRSDTVTATTFYKDHVIMWAKDLSRTIDYLETRKDLDASRLAYYGISWGGYLGSLLPAVEPRIRASVLYVAGLTFQAALPEVDPINYVSRVKQPTLILNGEFDFFFPAETSQKPLFDLLGTPAAQKKRLVYPGGHSVPRADTIRESLDWLDRYLGPVK